MRGRRLASFRMTMTKQELEDALARKQRTDTERLDWIWENHSSLEKVFQDAENSSDKDGNWSPSRFRAAIDAAMDAEEKG